MYLLLVMYIQLSCSYTYQVLPHFSVSKHASRFLYALRTYNLACLHLPLQAITLLCEMAKRKQLTEDLKKIIVALALKGKSLREIGETVGKTHSTVQYIVNKFKYQGSWKNLKRKSKDKKLNEWNERYILQQIRRDPRLSVPKLHSLVQDTTGKEMSHQTIRRVLWENGYHGRFPRKKPYISETNRVKRLLFANEHISKEQDYWDRVIWSDETKINLFCSDGGSRVWRKPNTDYRKENTIPTVKHGGGSIMIWACMSSSGVGNIHFIDGIMDKVMYKNILMKNLKQSAQKMGFHGYYTFQQDNDPKHTAEIVKRWLIWNVPHQLKTPPQSADLNPIEHVWPILKRRVRKSKITSIQELKRVVAEEWENITPEDCKKLVSPMKRRCEEVVKAKGYATRY